MGGKSGQQEVTVRVERVAMAPFSEDLMRGAVCGNVQTVSPFRDMVGRLR